MIRNRLNHLSLNEGGHRHRERGSKESHPCLNHLSLNEGGHPSADRSLLWGSLKSFLFNTLRLFIRLFFLTEIRLSCAHGA